MRWTFLSCSCTRLLSPPVSGPPQVTTAPVSRMAANAPPVDWMCWTFLSCSCTWLRSPPKFASPQVTTAPDSRMAAKAPRAVAWMCWTSLSCACTWLQSPPSCASPQVTTSPPWPKQTLVQQPACPAAQTASTTSPSHNASLSVDVKSSGWPFAGVKRRLKCRCAAPSSLMGVAGETSIQQPSPLGK